MARPEAAIASGTRDPRDQDQQHRAEQPERGEAPSGSNRAATATQGGEDDQHVAVAEFDGLAIRAPPQSRRSARRRPRGQRRAPAERIPDPARRRRRDRAARPARRRRGRRRELAATTIPPRRQRNGCAGARPRARTAHEHRHCSALTRRGVSLISSSVRDRPSPARASRRRSRSARRTRPPGDRPA